MVTKQMMDAIEEFTHLIFKFLSLLWLLAFLH